MSQCGFVVCAQDTRCSHPGTCRVVYELDDEPGMETEDYRSFCPRHAERYAEILRASGVVRTAAVEP